MKKFYELFSTYRFANDRERKLFETMFDAYVSDLPDNFYRNQFELANTYEGTTYEDWVKLMKHPAFDTWKAEQIAVIAAITTDRALAGGEDLENTNALNLLKARRDVLATEKHAERPTVIVLPDSLFFNDSSGGDS